MKSTWKNSERGVPLSTLSTLLKIIIILYIYKTSPPCRLSVYSVYSQQRDDTRRHPPVAALVSDITGVLVRVDRVDTYGGFLPVVFGNLIAGRDLR